MCALPRHLYLVRQLVLPSFKNSKNVFRSFKKLKQKLDVVMTYPKSMENRKTKLFKFATPKVGAGPSGVLEGKFPAPSSGPK
jgi:hypothetical protein